MASSTLIKAYFRRKTQAELETALDVLLDDALETSDLVEQRLNEVGFRFQIRSRADRERYVSIIEGAIALHEGDSVAGGYGHSMNFSRRPIE
jgi:hypothetical protein